MSKMLVLTWARSWNFWASLAVLILTIWFDLWARVDWWVGFLLWWAIFFGFLKPHVAIKRDN